MATMPAEPGGSAAPIFSPRPLSTRCLANRPTTPPAAPVTTIDASSGGENSPTTSPTPAPTLAPLRPRWSPVSWTLALPSVSTVTSATPSTSSCLSSTSLTSALKSCWARSGIRYAAMTTSKSVSLIVFFLREHSMVVLCVDRVRGECLVDLLMQLPLVLLADVWVDVEDDPLDGAGERERGLVR